MEFIDQDRLQWMVHYSFGDHGGMIGGSGKVPQAFVKKANRTNTEFLELCKKEPILTLFIDNVRLYRRPIEFSDWEHKKPIIPSDREWLDLFKDEDLLELCGSLPNKFIIFTALEDIPLDESIKIPDNVGCINACNSVYLNEKIRPWPHGLTRMMRNRYNSQVDLRWQMDQNVVPTKLLYMNHREDTGSRTQIKPMFKDKDWATVPERRADYPDYLAEIARHKFVLCPSGNGIDSARNWETLYLKRVPIFKDHPYLRELFKNFPALFVKDWSEVTKELLTQNEHLLELAQHNESFLDLNKLYAEYGGFQYYD